MQGGGGVFAAVLLLTVVAVGLVFEYARRWHALASYADALDVKPLMVLRDVCNPSILSLPGKQIAVTVRSMVSGLGMQPWTESRVFLASVDALEKLEMASFREIPCRGAPEYQGAHGWEDGRLFFAATKLCVLVAVRGRAGRFRQVIVELGASGEGVRSWLPPRRILDLVPTWPGGDVASFKNWAWLPTENELLFVHSVHPTHTIVAVDCRTGRAVVRHETPSEKAFRHIAGGRAIRGGSGAIRCGQVMVAAARVVRCASPVSSLRRPRCYRTVFYAFAATPPYQVLPEYVGREVLFRCNGTRRTPSIQMTTALTRLQDGRIIVAFGEEDRRAKFVALSEEQLVALLKK